MIGQHIHALHIGQRVEESPQPGEIVVAVGDAGDEHMTYPHRFVNVAQVAGAVENVAVGVLCQLAVLIVVYVLDVEQDSVGVLHQLFKLGKPRPLPCERLRRGVKTRVDAPLVSLAEEFREEVYLHQCLAAAHGDAALPAPIGAVVLGPVEQFVGRHLFPHARLPRVGVVAELAAHGATLQEDEKPDARAVHRTEGLDAVDEAEKG